MTRNLKVLSLALVAAFAMSAGVASVAFAQGVLTSDGQVELTATEAAATLTAFGNQKVECHAIHKKHKLGTTPAQKISTPAVTYTATSLYSGCVASIGETKAPATVTMNGCDYVLHVGARFSPGIYALTTDVVCPGSNSIEKHIYTNSSHTTLICTMTISAQTGLAGGVVENVANGDIRLGGPITGLTVTRTGILCGGSAETKNGELDANAVFSGTSEAGSPTDVSITD